MGNGNGIIICDEKKEVVRNLSISIRRINFIAADLDLRRLIDKILEGLNIYEKTVYNVQ
jgi:hypothetical protein